MLAATGLLKAGLSAAKSLSGISAKLAASFTSILSGAATLMK